MLSLFTTFLSDQTLEHLDSVHSCPERRASSGALCGVVRGLSHSQRNVIMEWLLIEAKRPFLA